MRRIPLPSVNDEKVFDDIAAAKQQPRRSHLQDVRDTVLMAYKGYESSAPEVEHLSNITLTARQSEALIHAFEVETVPMGRLRADLLKPVVVARCPFCSLSESATLDHYLPKEQNPQFAIFPKNLVPCCPICNTRKRDKVLGKIDNIRLFLHPYYDDIPQRLFVRVKISFHPNAIILKYTVVKHAGLASTTFKHLQSHFQQLGLADRYRRMALDDLRGQYHALVRIYGPAKDANRLAVSLTEKAKDFEAIYGENYWLTVLYYALAANRKFCNGGFQVLNKIQ